MSSKPHFITAIGTPLHDDDSLHIEGLHQHIDDQCDAGIDSLLVAGTMGMMFLLTDPTWQALMRESARVKNGRYELLVGATDTSTARALARINFVNTIDDIDGVVVMVPGAFKFSQPQYVSYFTDLANTSRYPIYLYDLQPLTGVHLSVETIVELAAHPNIAGIKMSANVPECIRLQERIKQGAIDGDRFRLIIAEPALSDMLFRAGYHEHLDGIYAICPHWAVSLSEAAERGDWKTAAVYQSKLLQIKELFIELPFSEAFTAAMNLRGIAGKFGPRPMSTPDAAFISRLKERPVIRELLAATPVEA